MAPRAAGRANAAVRWHPAAPSPFMARRVGLLGGSFNPAHRGHRHIAELALARLGLDEIWWLVSPQNPLKRTEGMAPAEARFRGAAAMARHPRMRVTDIERALGSAYTAEMLPRLRARYRRMRFVWIMGADNLLQIPAWKEWPEIFASVPVAVFARPTYSARALSGAAAARFARFRLSEGAARSLVRCNPPAWVYIHGRLHAASATALRKAASAAAKAKR